MLDETTQSLIAAIRAAHLSYCGPPKLESLAQAVVSSRLERVPGDYIEAGVALGGSAILLGRLKPRDAMLSLYDVFSAIPAPGSKDGIDAHRRYEEICSGESPGIGGDKYYGYIDNLEDVVRDNLRRFGIDPAGADLRFVRGLFADTLHPHGPIAVAHIDCDWYESVRTCIDRILPHLSLGGIMVFDDYSSYSGCRRAVDERLANDPTMEVVFHARSFGVRRIAA